LQPLVSVVIANHNYGRYLAQCIDSVLAQTYPNIEVIVVDDGSTDESRDVLAGYATSVRVLLQQNAGQAAAFSAGVAASRGELVCLLDSDDTWHPDKVAAVVETFRAHPQIQWLRHKFAVVDERLQPLHSEVPAFRGSGHVRPDPMLLLESGLRAGTSLVMRRVLADRIFPVQITPELALHADDTVILARIFAQRAPGYSLDRVLGFYRRHPGTRFNSDDLLPSLQREAALGVALGNLLGAGAPSSSYKLYSVIAALKGASPWQQERLTAFLHGLLATRRLWSRPRLLARQVLALSYAYAAPRRWVQTMLKRGVPAQR
jgi:glycosyltransferase involved in cell wall biosynthesis